MIAAIQRFYRRLSGPIPNALMLLAVRVALAGIFWRSGRLKIEEGSWFTISDSTHNLFQTEYAGVPLPPDFAAVTATVAEHLLPILLVIGLASRPVALALIGMTMVIQLFVYPEAWWPVHNIWVALALVIIVCGPGLFSMDAWFASRLPPAARPAPVVWEQTA